MMSPPGIVQAMMVITCCGSTEGGLEIGSWLAGDIEDDGGGSGWRADFNKFVYIPSVAEIESAADYK